MQRAIIEGYIFIILPFPPKKFGDPVFISKQMHFVSNVIGIITNLINSYFTYACLKQRKLFEMVVVMHILLFE